MKGLIKWCLAISISVLPFMSLADDDLKEYALIMVPDRYAEVVNGDIEVSNGVFESELIVRGNKTAKYDGGECAPLFQHAYGCIQPQALTIISVDFDKMRYMKTTQMYMGGKNYAFMSMGILRFAE